MLTKLILILLTEWNPFSSLGSIEQRPSPSQHDTHSNSPKKVPVTLAVMSRCPDAILCESVFDKVLKKVKSKATIELTFIAREDKSDEDYGVKCLHGPLECAGNIQELCSAKYEPQSKWWPFVQCLNRQGRPTIGYDETAEICADEVGFDWAGSSIDNCVHSSEGVGLLKESIAFTRSLNATKSCTIIINGKKRCVHDETWKECKDGHKVSDFVRLIDQEYDAINSESRVFLSRITPPQIALS